MTRRTDLEQHLRDSYKLIKEYEEILRLSADPMERARARRAIDDQWGFILEYLAEYSPQCQATQSAVPPDIAQISVAAGLHVAPQTPAHLNSAATTNDTQLVDPASYPTTLASPYNDLGGSLRAGNVCAFVGAGLSVGAGLPGWYDLMGELAARIGYKLAPREWATGDALIDAAQAYVNRQGLHSLISHLKDRLDTTGKQPTAAHRALARLPISLVFTANFDDLLERAFRDAGKRVEVVVKDSSIPFMRRGSDTVNIVKLYGDLDQPDTIVLARQQYESYFLQRPQMVKLLETELARSDTLYLGWSGSDPYFKLVFGELLSRFGGMMRPGYAVMFDVTDDQRDELRRKQIRLVELPPGDRTAQLAAWLEGLTGVTPTSGPSGASGVNSAGTAQVASGSRQASPRSWDRPAIRQLLADAFNDEELTTLCFDHFTDVYEGFGSGMSKPDKILRLLDYCIRRDQLEALLALVRDANLAQYRRHEGQLRG